MAVAGLCAVVAVAVVAVLGGSGAAPARAHQEAVATPSDSFASHSHSGDLGVQGMTEKQLRAFETATLGPAHAREHALMRRALRWEKAHPAATRMAERRVAAQVAADDAPVGDPADVGQWESAKTAFPIVAIHAAMLPTGKVLFFSYPTYPNRPNNAQAYLWDPTHPNQPVVEKDPPDKANIWCAGQTFLADGELLVFGGNLDYESPSQTWKGLDRVFTFNPWTETWQEQPRMAHGRWYPTGVRLPDGRVPIFSGLDESGQLIPHSNTNPDVELFTPSDQMGGVGTITKIGTIGTGDDTERAQKPLGNLYPRMIVMADGHDYTAGPDKDQTWVLDDPDATPTFSWHDIPNMSRGRVWGTTVPLPAGASGPTRMLAMGGTEFSGDPSTTTTELFDINNVGAGWQLQTGKDNLYGRGHANTVLLPDGSMAEVGGGRGSLDGYESPLHYAEPEKRHIELWDPQTGKWRLGPAQTEARAYHSTALLLPDGRVMSAGDDFNGDPGKIDASTDNDPMEDTAEIYEPPYLFRGPRPTITNAPAAIGFNGSFGVDTPNTNITKAALAAPAAVTHGVDMNQRMLQLPVDQRSGCVSVTAPTGPNAAPPGWYMLFLLNDQGVPSIAKWVKLQQGGTLGGCGTAPPDDTAAPTVDITSPGAGTLAGTVTFRATASDDRGVVGVRLYVDGDEIANDTSSPYEASWNTTNVANGQHTLKAVARDASGKTAEDTLTVTVGNTDTTAPTVDITAPASGATVSGVIPVSANASDASGISQVQFEVDGTAIGGPDATAPYSVQWGSINVENGTHTLSAVASDTFGNQSTASVDVTVHNEDGTPVNGLPPKKTPQGGGGETPGGGGSGGGGGGGKTGGGGGGGTTKTPDEVAPALRKLKLSSSRFRRGKLTTISFRLSEAARVVLTFEQKLSGRRVHGRCTKPRKGARANCTRYLRVSGGLSANAKAGTNTIGFRGRLSRKRMLAPGSYRLTLLARDAAGNWSTPASAGFKLLGSAGAARERAVRATVLRWF